jgi:predicted ABC-type ATPase
MQISKQSIDIINELFLGHCQSQNEPQLFATCGIPGAGKTTFVDAKLASGEFPADAFILNPDRVMLALPEYQADRDARGAQAAYQTWELPCRDLAYAMADYAAAQRFNVIKDMGCANPLSLRFVENAKSDGYGVFMYHIHCDLDEAYRRIDQRDFQISRDAVKQRYDLLQKLLPSYKSVANHFYDFDNTDLAMPFQIAA